MLDSSGAGAYAFLQWLPSPGYIDMHDYRAMTLPHFFDCKPQEMMLKN